MNDRESHCEEKRVAMTHQSEKETAKSVTFEGYESALTFFKSQLWDEGGKETLRYLKQKRRYTEEEIKDMELGFFPPQETANLHLGDLMNVLGLTERGFGSTHKLVIAYRDPWGRLKGFIVRRLTAQRPKFIYSAGTLRDTLFNSHLLGSDATHAVVVEGYFDALIAAHRGIEGVVAIGGTRLTQQMLEDMIEKGIRRVTLIPDNDLRGQLGAVQSLQLIGEKGLHAFVVELPPTVKDLDEFIRKMGIDAFKELKQQPLSGDRWREKYVKKKRDRIKVQIRTGDTTAQPSRIYYIKREEES